MKFLILICLSLLSGSLYAQSKVDLKEDFAYNGTGTDDIFCRIYVVKANALEMTIYYQEYGVTELVMNRSSTNENWSVNLGQLTAEIRPSDERGFNFILKDKKNKIVSSCQNMKKGSNNDFHTTVY